MNIINLTSSTFPENFLKCDFCKNYLSHFPIYLSPENANICGRCLPIENSYIHNIAYETISQFFQFPCRYKNEGCMKELLPKEIPKHEKCCCYRIMQCPCTECDWKGPYRNLFEHCYDAHSDNILQNGKLEADLSYSKEVIKFMEYKGEMFAMNIKCNYSKQILLCTVYYFNYEMNKENFWYTLKLNNGNTSEFQVKFIDDIKYIECPFKDTFLNAIVKIKTSPREDKANTKMLATLKCYNCSQFALPPIYHCSRNETTICLDCKEEHSRNCDCWTQFGKEIRNISLDNIANMLNYPCRNQTRGCSYVGKPDEIKRHQQSCKFTEFQCPLHEYYSCFWKGLEHEIIAHIQEKHPILLMNNGNLISFNTTNSEQVFCRLISFENHLFKLLVAKLDGVLYWSVQLTGHFVDNFKYEIEIFDQSKGRFLMRNSCSPSIENSKLFKNSQNCCCLHDEQIKWVVTSKSELIFKVRILN